jgi:Glycosyl transferase family 2
MTVLMVEATGDTADLSLRLRQVAAAGYGEPVVIVAEAADAIAAAAEATRQSPLHLKTARAADVAALLDRLDARTPVAFLPYGATFSAPDWSRMKRLPRSVMAWPIDKKLPEHSCSEPDSTIDGWVMSADVARAALAGRSPAQWRLSALGPVLETMAESVHWISNPNAAPPLYPPEASAAPKLTRSSRVIAVIPHFACEPWLAAALASLTQQTRKPDAIVVVDDASREPPADICRRFPEVTLLRSMENVGPYRLTQQVINDGDYDAILFQDADDWSCADRLERCLDEIERTGAEWIGTQEIRLAESGAYQPASYPLDVNRASENGPQHPLLNPTSMVARALVQRLGGFATGLRFSNDTELLYRAVFDARIVNLPDFSFIHRKRQNSMVSSPEIGMQSRKRQDLLKLLHDRADENVLRRRAGKALDLTPLSKAPGVELLHVCGPRLRAAAG